MKPLLQAMKERRLYLDGGMGSMLQAAGLPEGLLPDVWGMQNPAAVQGVHRAYLEAGARLITTNTFGTSAPKLAPYGVTVDEVMAAAVANVRQAMQQAGVEDAYVCADLGPSGKLLRPYGDLDFEDAVTLFAETVRAAAKAGADCILIETMSDLYEMKAAVLAAKENCDLPILASLIFDATGKLLTGGSPRAAVGLLEGLGVDVLGINCGLGPKEMAPTFEALWEDSSTPLLLQPNAGLPHSVDGKAVYDVSPEEYAAEMLPLAPMATILGGCCGTTPQHIAALRTALDALPEALPAAPAAKPAATAKPVVETDDAFLRKLRTGQRVIAVELDSPKDADLTAYLEGARRLQAAGADLLTIADCPIARARMDSSLVACRVHRELGMNVLPHMTCRDRNLNATKALLLGLYAEGVREVLAITGDPIPTAERDEVKNVYQFNSRKLAQYIVSLAGEGREMPSPITVFGALNLNARNFEVELRRAAEKLENGMSGFLTQPVLSAQAVENLKKTRETLGERAKILAGILPVVSQRNAIFMENEVNGIHVDEAIIQKFEGLDRTAGEELGLEVSVQAAKAAAPYADGFYLMTPFNRVALMERLIARLRTEVTD